MSGKNYKIIISPKVIKKLKTLTLDIQHKINKAISGLAAIPPQGDIKKLTNMNGIYRLRVGNWRVSFLFDKTNKEVHVVAIAQRKDAYK